jgi:four helix bundle protein
MSEQSEALKERTMEFGVRILRLIDSLPHSRGASVVAYQLAKSATSIGANYRASCSARSRREFIARLGIVYEETDESDFWLELIVRAGLQMRDQVASLLDEVKELRRIFGASLGTARARFRARAKARRAALWSFDIDMRQAGAPQITNFHQSLNDQTTRRPDDQMTK